jgi:hypothetical protein
MTREIWFFIQPALDCPGLEGSQQHFKERRTEAVYLFRRLHMPRDFHPPFPNVPSHLAFSLPFSSPDGVVTGQKFCKTWGPGWWLGGY